MAFVTFKKLLIVVIFIICIDICVAARPLIGGNPCTRGPAYWCASAANAAECGRGATTYCLSKSGFKTTTTTEPPLVGGNPCTWGPSYWCASAANAAECDFPVEECAKYVDIQN